jgi:leucyl-tRNA synthetase
LLDETGEEDRHRLHREDVEVEAKNVVDPDDIIATYGADTARWFMLSDSPPERDVIWTEEGVQGASRFVQRLWRLVEAAALALEAVQRALEGRPPKKVIVVPQRIVNVVA